VVHLIGSISAWAKKTNDRLGWRKLQASFEDSCSTSIHGPVGVILSFADFDAEGEVSQKIDANMRDLSSYSKWDCDDFSVELACCVLVDYQS